MLVDGNILDSHTPLANFLSLGSTVAKWNHEQQMTAINGMMRNSRFYFDALC